MGRHYFVDYDVYWGGQVVMYGQLALTWRVAPGAPFAPEALLTHVLDRAAARHGVDPNEIRVRTLARV